MDDFSTSLADQHRIGPITNSEASALRDRLKSLLRATVSQDATIAALEQKLQEVATRMTELDDLARRVKDIETAAILRVSNLETQVAELTKQLT